MCPTAAGSLHSRVSLGLFVRFHSRLLKGRQVVGRGGLTSTCSRFAPGGLTTALLFGIFYDAFNIKIVKNEFYAKTAAEHAIIKEREAAAAKA